MDDQTYDRERARKLVELLRALGARIAGLKDDADLLAAGPELMKLMGDARSELFHYEVRATYDTPEVAESRRIVEEALRNRERTDFDLGGVAQSRPNRLGLEGRRAVAAPNLKIFYIVLIFVAAIGAGAIVYARGNGR